MSRFGRYETHDLATPAEGAKVKRRTFLSMAAGLGAAGLGAVAVPDLVSGRGSLLAPTYKFSDEFEGPAESAPDPTKWAYDLGGGGWGNNELEVYTSSRLNSFIDGNSNLVIRATRGTVTSGHTTTNAYYSARLKTQGKFSQYRGTFEARIKLNIQSGAWPAWWMMGSNINTVRWPRCGEVDMLENYGKSATVETTVHTPNNAATSTLSKYADTPADNNWHIWRVVWGSTGFTFYKDGTQYLAVSPSQLSNWCFSSGVPMFMLLNLAIGGFAGSPPPNSAFPIDMLVDYVHVW